MAERNLALNKNITASSSVAPYAPSRAVDGQITPVSRWLSKTVPAYLTVDLGASYLITTWVVKHMSMAGWKESDYNMCDFKLQASNDNITWYDIDAVINNTSSTTARNVNLDLCYRYVRLYITKGLRTNPQMASLVEFEVYGKPSSYLRALGVSTTSPLTLKPAFGPTVLTYTTENVPSNISSIFITPTAQDAQAAIKVNGAVAASGTAVPVALITGSNTINIEVTASDQITKTNYSVTIVKEGSPSAHLSGLTISAGTLNPTFTPHTTSYSASVGFDVKTITVTPSITSSGVSITVNGIPVASGTASQPINLSAGATTDISIAVIGSDSLNTYTVAVTRASSPYLSKAEITYKDSRGRDIVKSVPIEPDKTEYLVDIDNAAKSAQVRVYTEDTNAKICVNRTQNLTNGQISEAIPVSPVDRTRIPIDITSNIGSDSRTYAIITI